MSAEEYMALARRFLQARVKGDRAAVDEMLAPDFVSHAPHLSGPTPDREGPMLATTQFSAALSDVRFVIEDRIAAGDKVVSRFIMRATHDRGELIGVAPSGRELVSTTNFIHRISGGKIAEEWGVGTGPSELLGRRLEQERIERERVEQELRVARRIQQASP
jgi:ketosteroid isomerase-like protein